MHNTRKLYPPIYKGFKEIDVLADIQENQKLEYQEEVDRFLRNQFISTCEVAKLEEIEKILKIPIRGEDIEFRRERVLNRLSMTPPFSMPFLRMKLDGIIGVNKYEIKMDHENYTMYVESSAVNQLWFNEIYITVNKVKPCNIVFVNKPITKRKVVINEEVEYVKRLYNYKLGSWQLGIKPFTSLGDREDIKLKEGRSITPSLLSDLMLFTKDKITKVRLNNSVIITEFKTKEVVDGKLLLEYIVHNSAGISEITKVELLDNNNSAKSTMDVYVPIVDGVELKHLIGIEEGVI